MAESNLFASDELIAKVTSYVREYMAAYDPSHDFNHIQRVVGLAQTIHAKTAVHPPLDLRIITLAALLHDVGDRKYLKPGEDASKMVHAALVTLGADAALAERIQTICLGVSYSSEVKDPERVRSLIQGGYPELAVVQDADRLDAIGAVGIGRVFTFGGAKNRDMGLSLQHFDDKLLRIQGLMKTDAGREMARERSERLLLFKEWWLAEHSTTPN
jgi:uncharacterized protein